MLQSVIGYDRRGGSSRAAGQRFVFDAPFVGPHPDFALACDLCEIDVRPLRKTRRVVTDHPSQTLYVHAVQLLREFHIVGNARIEEPPAFAAADFRYIYHAQLDLARPVLRAAYARGVHAVRGVEILGFSADAQMLGEKRETPCAVAAHFARRTVGVVVAHRAVHLDAALQGHQPVGSDAEVAVAQVRDQPCVGAEQLFAVIDEDEIVACALVFYE